MHKLFTLAASIFIYYSNASAQYPVKSATYLQVQFSPTLSDRTIDENPWLAGFGLQKIFGSNTAVKGQLELTGEIYPVDDKVYRINPDGSELKSISATLHLFGGVMVKISDLAFLSGGAGPCLTAGGVHFGVKPSLGTFLTSRHRTFIRLSYISIFKRESYSKQDYRAVSFTFGVRLN